MWKFISKRSRNLYNFHYFLKIKKNDWLTNYEFNKQTKNKIKMNTIWNYDNFFVENLKYLFILWKKEENISWWIV